MSEIMFSRSHCGTRRRPRLLWGARLFDSPAIVPPHYHQHSMQHKRNMDFVDSVSKPFKKLKHRFKEHRHKREGGSRGDSRGWGEHNTEGSQTGQSSLPPPEAEGMVESGPSGEKRDGDDREIVQDDPPTSGPSISPSDNAKPNGTWAVSLYCSTPHRSFNKHSHFCLSGSRPGGP